MRKRANTPFENGFFRAIISALTALINNAQNEFLRVNRVIAPLILIMEVKYNAICIRSVPYRDNDKVLTLFTLEKGLVDCILRGAKKPTAKLRFAGEIFCFAEYVLVEKDDRRTVVEANEIDGFYGLRLDIDKYYCASAIIEFLRGFLRSELVSYELFLATTTALKSIENGFVSPVITLVKFYMESLKEVGYGIDYLSCGKCKKEILKRAFFDFDNCVFTCLDCADISCVEMRIKTYALIRDLDKISLNDLKNQRLSTYSPTFDDKDAQLFALRFFDFFIRDKAGVSINSNKSFLSPFDNPVS